MNSSLATARCVFALPVLRKVSLAAMSALKSRIHPFYPYWHVCVALLTVFVDCALFAKNQEKQVQCELLTPGGWTDIPDTEPWCLSLFTRFRIRVRGAEGPINIFFIDPVGSVGEIACVIPHGDIVFTESDIRLGFVFNRAYRVVDGIFFMLILDADSPFQGELVASAQKALISQSEKYLANVKQEEGVELARRELLRAHPVLKSYCDDWNRIHGPSGRYAYIRPLILHPAANEPDPDYVMADNAVRKLAHSALLDRRGVPQELERTTVRDAIERVFAAFPIENYPAGHTFVSSALAFSAECHLQWGETEAACEQLSRVRLSIKERLRACDSITLKAEAMMFFTRWGRVLSSYNHHTLASEFFGEGVRLCGSTRLVVTKSYDLFWLLFLAEVLSAKTELIAGLLTPEQAADRMRAILERTSRLKGTGNPRYLPDVSAVCVGEFYSSIGHFSESRHYWRVGVTTWLNAVPVPTSLNSGALAQTLISAARSAILAGEYSDAVVYLRLLGDIEAQVSLEGYADIGALCVDKALCYYLLGNVERAAECVDQGLQYFSKQKLVSVRGTDIRTLAMLEVLREFLRGDHEIGNDLFCASLGKRDSVESIVEEADLAILLLKASVQTGRSPDARLFQHVRERIRKLMDDPKLVPGGLTERAQAADAMFRVLDAIQEIRTNRFDRAQQLLHEVQQVYPQLAAARGSPVRLHLLTATMELANRTGQVPALELLEEYYRENVYVGLRRVRWGSLGIVDPFSSHLRQAECEYLRRAWSEKVDGSVAYGKTLARHRLDYRLDLVPPTANQAAGRAGEAQANRGQSDVAPSGTTQTQWSRDQQYDAGYYGQSQWPHSWSDPFGKVSLLIRAVQAAHPRIGLPSGDVDEVVRLEKTALNIPPQSAILDYVRVERERSSARYMLFICQRCSDPPGQTIEWLDLGEVAPVDEAVRSWRQAIETGRSADAPRHLLRARLFEPAENRLRDDVRRVYFVPDGPLCQLPWCALPGRDPASMLLEDYAIALLPYGGFLTDRGFHEKPPLRDRPPRRYLLVGAVDYDSRRLPEAHQDIQSQPPPRRWASLPHTTQEINAIQALLSPEEVLRLTGPHATSYQLLRLLPQVGWAHLATHGFFFNPETAFPAGGEPQDAPRAAMARFHPLLLNGLVLAGANMGTVRNPLGLPLDDSGLLTGRMIADTPLPNLEMVVLSACQTGAGVAVGDGTVGLQRAFHLAGVENVVASLWRVDDQTAAVLMRLFYSYVFQDGVSPIEALRRAQLVVLRSPEKLSALALLRGPDFSQAARRLHADSQSASAFRPPERLWAAFVLSGPGL